MPHFYNFFQEIIAKEAVPNTFNKVTIPIVDITRNKNYGVISLMNIDNISYKYLQMLANQF